MKKFVVLLLVLALVFAFAAAASATDFTDDEAITYQDAVELLSALGVLDGFPDGSFDPDGNVTREQAAKIIAYILLGPEAADKLVAESAPFSDVAANRWSAGYIAYCVREGILDGYGNGKFGPTDQVTGFQLAKMLLCAIGYGANNEFTGTGWSANVAKFAIPLGMFEGNEDGANNNPANREEAALYAFNTLFIDLVKFNAFLNEYLNGPFDMDDDDEDYGTLAENVFDIETETGIVMANAQTTLEYAATEDEEAQTEILLDVEYLPQGDAYGVGPEDWYTSMLFDFDTPLSLIGHKVKVFYYVDEETKDNVAYIMLDKATLVKEVTTHIDFDALEESSIDDELSDFCDLEAKAAAAGFKKGTVPDGDLVITYNLLNTYGLGINVYSLGYMSYIYQSLCYECGYLGDNNLDFTLISNSAKKDVDFVLWNVYGLDKVTNVATKDGVTTYTMYGEYISGHKLDTAPGGDYADAIATGDIAKGDYVLVLPAGEVTHLLPAPSVTGEVDALTYVGGSDYYSVGIDDKTYDIATQAFNVSDLPGVGQYDGIDYEYELNISIGDVAEFYTDPSGNLIAFDASVVKTSWAYVADFGWKDDELGADEILYALVYFADGESGIYEVDEDRSAEYIGSISAFGTGLWEVKELTSGKVAVTWPDEDTFWWGNSSMQTFTFTKGVSKVGGAESLYTDANTVAFYVSGSYEDDDLEVNILTGTANILSSSDDIEQLEGVAVYREDKDISLFSALLFGGDAASGSQELVYYNGEYKEVTTGDKTTVTYTVYKDGEKKEVSYDDPEDIWGSGSYENGFYEIGAKNLKPYDTAFAGSEKNKAEFAALSEAYFGSILSLNGYWQNDFDVKITDATVITDLTADEDFDGDWEPEEGYVFVAVNWTEDSAGTKIADAIYVIDEPDMPK